MSVYALCLSQQGLAVVPSTVMEALYQADEYAQDGHSEASASELSEYEQQPDTLGSSSDLTHPSTKLVALEFPFRRNSISAQKESMEPHKVADPVRQQLDGSPRPVKGRRKALNTATTGTSATIHGAVVANLADLLRFACACVMPRCKAGTHTASCTVQSFTSGKSSKEEAAPFGGISHQTGWVPMHSPSLKYDMAFRRIFPLSHRGHNPTTATSPSKRQTKPATERHRCIIIVRCRSQNDDLHRITRCASGGLKGNTY